MAEQIFLCQQGCSYRLGSGPGEWSERGRQRKAACPELAEWACPRGCAHLRRSQRFV